MCASSIVSRGCCCCTRYVPFKLVIVFGLWQWMGDTHCISFSLSISVYLSLALSADPTNKEKNNLSHSVNASRPICSSNLKSCDCLLRIHNLFLFFIYFFSFVFHFDKMYARRGRGSRVQTTPRESVCECPRLSNKLSWIGFESVDETRKINELYWVPCRCIWSFLDAEYFTGDSIRFATTVCSGLN